MFEAIIKGLIGLLLAALAVYLIVWVLGIIGIVIPPHILPILWAIAILLVILWLYATIVKPNWGRWFPP